MTFRFCHIANQQLSLMAAGGLLMMAVSPAAASESVALRPAQIPTSVTDVDEAPFSIRLGLGFADYQTSGSASSNGVSIPDASVAFGRHAVGSIEAGWRFAPNWSLSVLSGVPPTVSLKGEGAFAELGKLREVTYGSVMAGLQYHPFGRSWIDPYIGVGLDYTFIFGTSGGSMSELRVADNFGPILQAGAEFKLTDRFSFYADVRKIWLSFDAKGVAPTGAGPLPVSVEVHPNPLVATFGISYHF
ncbi:OmpW/AlkL family protein [Teichococcus vastitatis]|uniref:OmpW/AlkL family protein n=1 Tax=Teichococcus vastitatis TaxID=2307076 RepID=UPI00130047EF|nr:OmpW family outer membrane protein [Pseudoroseomonas vastitatis]